MMLYFHPCHWVRGVASTSRASGMTRRRLHYTAASYRDTSLQPNDPLQQPKPFELSVDTPNRALEHSDEPKPRHSSSRKPTFSHRYTESGRAYIGWSSRVKVYSSPLPGSLLDSNSPERELKVTGNILQIRTPLTDEWRVVPGIWLRDLCPCPQCRHPITKQRNVNVLNTGADAISVVHVDITQRPKRGIWVKFADGHETRIPAHTINHRRTEHHTRNITEQVPVQTWSASIAEDPPTIAYADIQTGTGITCLLHRMWVYGFAFVQGIPPTPEASKALLECIGPIRNTHYGAFYDFTSDLSSKDTAYTSEALGPHTDNTYFTEPAGLQGLHLLSHTEINGDTAEGLGGESSLVDGFAAAEQLFHLYPAAYKTLSTAGVWAHASGNEGISIQPAQAFPTLTHNPDTHKLQQVRWNNADRSGVAVPWSKLEEWYDAAAKFQAILHDPKNQYWFQLQPGKLLLFDNWRLLHGRTAFTGKRRMCGGYINRDDWISRYRTTNLSKEELEISTFTG